jgi:hypothetical protein
MCLHPQLEVHVPADEVSSKVWFLELPSRMVAERDGVSRALIEVVDQENARLREREPADPNYLAVLGSDHHAIEPSPEGPFPWEHDGAIVWESSHCWTLGEPHDGADPSRRWTPIPSAEFTMLYLLRTLRSGALARETFLRLATKELFQFPPDIAAKMADNPDGWISLHRRFGRLGSG